MKLLNKTVRYYFLLSVILLLVAVPVFYFVLKRIVIANVDARLIATKTQLVPRLQVMEETPEGNNPLLNNDITLERAAPHSGRDSLYTSDVVDSSSRRRVTYRLLTSHLVINRETYRLQIKSSLANHEALITSIIILQVLLLSLLLAGLLLINRSGAPQGAGRDTAAAEIMRLAGLDNVLEGQQGYKPLSPEAIGALAPDLIIVTRESLQASGGLEGFARLPGIAATQAAAKQRIIVMDDLLILGLGPRLPQALIQLKQEAAHAMAR